MAIMEQKLSEMITDDAIHLKIWLPGLCEIIHALLQ